MDVWRARRGSEAVARCKERRFGLNIHALTTRSDARMAHGHDSFLQAPELLSADEDPRDRGRGFEVFLREQQPALLQFLRLRTSEEDARDIAQESLARLLRYRDNEPAEAWKIGRAHV